MTTTFRRLGRLPLLAVAVAIAVVAQVREASGAVGLGPDWNAWKASAPIRVAPVKDAASENYARVVLPPRIDAGTAGDYADLRVVDDSGSETPYAIDPSGASASETNPTLPLSDTGFVAGAYSQAVADAGERATLHDAVTIETSRPTFFVAADVEASDDRVRWRDLASRTTLYRIAERGDAGNQTIVFPATRSRWLRVRIYDAHASFPIDGVDVAQARRAPAPLAPLAATPRAIPSANDGTERFVLDLGTPHVAFSAIRIDGTRGYFSRHVTVESSRDGRTWEGAGDGTIERFAEGGSHTGFAFAEARGRYARVTIENYNDAPLTGVRPVLLTRPRQLVFDARPGRSYRLLFDDTNASSPVYDFGERLARENWSAPFAGSVGAVAIDTTEPPDTRSFFERYPWLVNLAFAVAGIVLAVFAVRTISSANASTDPPAKST